MLVQRAASWPLKGSFNFLSPKELGIPKAPQVPSPTRSQGQASAAGVGWLGTNSLAWAFKGFNSTSKQLKSGLLGAATTPSHPAAIADGRSPCGFVETHTLG